MAGAIVEVQAPIFVLREWHRHRTQCLSGVTMITCVTPNGTSYQRSIKSIFELKYGGVQDAETFREVIQNHYDDLEHTYQLALNEGVPKELARIVLPVGRYSRMRASANLRNWLGFLTLRMAPQAQWEIRQYAEALHAVLAPLFPRTVGLFDGGRETDRKRE